MKSLCGMLLIGLVFFAVPRLTYGDEAEISELKNRIENLEKKVEIMNQTLLRLLVIIDKQSSASSNPPSITLPQVKWQDKQNWRKLRSGMSKDEVRSLLGEPDTIDHLGFLEAWSYGEFVDGIVRFSSKEKLESWMEPR